MYENSAAYSDFIRMKDGGLGRSAMGWRCDVCSTNLCDADQYQAHLKGKPHERKLRVRAGNTRVRTVIVIVQLSFWGDFILHLLP